MESGETLDSESLYQIASEASNLQFDQNSGLYFDSHKDMYYDPTSSVYYDYKDATYYRIRSTVLRGVDNQGHPNSIDDIQIKVPLYFREVG